MHPFAAGGHEADDVEEPVLIGAEDEVVGARLADGQFDGGSLLRGASMICTKRRSRAQRSISFTAATGSSCETTSVPRRRASLSSHSATCQSLCAVASASAKPILRSLPTLPNSGMRIPLMMLNGSRCCSRIKSRSDPGGPPDGGQASRRQINGAERGY